MENTKKILMISSLSCLAVSCLMLILAVFGVQVFDGILLRILLIVSTFAIACGLAIGELSVIQKNKQSNRCFNNYHNIFYDFHNFINCYLF